MDIDKLHKAFSQSKGVCTDTRSLKEEQMFFALKGDNFDGNKYVKKALEQGAMYAVSDDKSVASTEQNIFYVNSVLETLQELANFHRNQLDSIIIAITGTNGKTTTKELLYATLSQKYKVQKTTGNLNNHIGVPLTLLSIKDDSEFAIVEMGANKRGDIKELSDIAEPDFGIITNIGKAHLEGFGSVETIVKTKGELYDFLSKNGGLAFVNAKDSKLIKRLPVGLEVILYNKTNYSTAKSEAGLLKIEMGNSDKQEWITTQLFGDFNLANVVVGLEVAEYFDVPLEKRKKAIEDYTPDLMRSQVSKVDDTVFYIDAYNANPSSMALGIANFMELEGNKTMILGDMKELGDEELSYHDAILADVPNDYDGELILIGEIFNTTKGKTDAQKFKTTAEFIEAYDLSKLKNRLVFLKGSRSIGLERIVSAFKEF